LNIIDSILDIQEEHDYFYMASCYSQHPDGIDVAMDQACIAAAWLMQRGVHILAPIPHSHPIQAKLPKETWAHDFWMAQDFPLVAHAKGVILVEMPGWEKSKGMTMEAAWAKAWKKPVFRLSWPLS